MTSYTDMRFKFLFCAIPIMAYWQLSKQSSKVHSRLIGVIGFLRRWLAAEEISKLYTELPLNQVRFWNKNKGPLRSSESAVFSRRHISPVQDIRVSWWCGKYFILYPLFWDFRALYFYFRRYLQQAKQKTNNNIKLIYQC